MHYELVSIILLLVPFIACDRYYPAWNEATIPLSKTPDIANGWVQFDNNRDTGLYKVFTDQPMDFFEAQQNCREFGAHLASFRSEEEFKFIVSLAGRNNFWLGLFHRGEKLPTVPNYKLYFTDHTPYTLSEDEDDHAKYWGKYYTDDIHHHYAQTTRTNSYAFDPNNDEGKQHCAYLSFGSAWYMNGDKLDDWSCDQPKDAHICRYSPKTEKVEPAFTESEWSKVRFGSSEANQIKPESSEKTEEIMPTTPDALEVDVPSRIRKLVNALRSNFGK
ncbi:lectin c-type domain-containing protein [Ditylenchus destructor]|nr:lectin c-type domain-containing protein [Ditylenchus destructor]